MHLSSSRAAVLALGVLIAGSSTACYVGGEGRDPGSGEEGEDEAPLILSCDQAFMSTFPVRGPHNIGWDNDSCGSGPCAVSCPDANANTDWGGDHHGIDVFAHHRAELVAVTDAKVVAVGVPSNTSGLRVRLRDACGWEFYYGHLDEAAVSVGQDVEAGELIGFMGHTGASSDHLHFNVSYGGNYFDDIDPFSLLESTSPSACAPALPDPNTHVIVDVTGYLPTGSGYTPINARRVLDTRGERKPLYSGESMPVNVTEFTNLEPEAIEAVVLNVTAVDPVGPGFLTVFPSDEVYSGTSNVNFAPGQATAGLVFAKPGLDGDVRVRHVGESTHVVIDLLGWFSTSSDLEMITPTRALDTRESGTKVHGALDIPLTGAGGIPSAGVGAVVLNLAVTKPDAAGYAKLYAADSPEPETSNLNYAAGETRANLVVVPLSDAGVARLSSLRPAHFIVDVLGWFPEDSELTTIMPFRLADTRGGEALVTGEILDLDFSGKGAVPDAGVEAVLGNITVTQPTNHGFLRLFATGEPEPETSNLNFGSGKTVGNAFIVGVGASGDISLQAHIAH